MRMIVLAAKAILCVTPWPLRRLLLSRIFGYRLGAGVRISAFSWIYPDILEMDAGSRVGPFNVAIHIHRMTLGEKASIGRNNWLTGHPKNSTSHFSHRAGRDPSLILGRHSAITKSHLIDCTDRVQIGDFSTIAGYRSQLLTHSIDVYASRQDCKPITIGNHCFVGTNCILLGGSALPDRSVLGALSVLGKEYEEIHSLYAGNPARRVKQIDADAAYFHRVTGYVD